MGEEYELPPAIDAGRTIRIVLATVLILAVWGIASVVGLMILLMGAFATEAVIVDPMLVALPLLAALAVVSGAIGLTLLALLLVVKRGRRHLVIAGSVFTGIAIVTVIGLRVAVAFAA